MSDERTEDLDRTERSEAETAAERERAQRVARVIDSVRRGTYQVQSDVVANRIIDAMLRRPKKG